MNHLFARFATVFENEKVKLIAAVCATIFALNSLYIMGFVMHVPANFRPLILTSIRGELFWEFLFVSAVSASLMRGLIYYLRIPELVSKPLALLELYVRDHFARTKSLKYGVEPRARVVSKKIASKMPVIDTMLDVVLMRGARALIIYASNSWAIQVLGTCFFTSGIIGGKLGVGMFAIAAVFLFFAVSINWEKLEHATELPSLENIVGFWGWNALNTGLSLLIVSVLFYGLGQSRVDNLSEQISSITLETGEVVAGSVIFSDQIGILVRRENKDCTDDVLVVSHEFEFYPSGSFGRIGSLGDQPSYQCGGR